jgi:RNA polymerase sigma-70 factor (ECF subfamily)
MGYLRLVRSGVPATSPESDCLDLYDRELDYLFATLQRFGARAGEMEDLLQEIFIVLYRQWPTLDTTRSLRPWLFGVAFRVVRAHRRRQTRDQRREEPIEEPEAPRPDVGLEDQESMALLLSGLEQIPAARRAVVMMHDLDGLAIADIARRLSMTKIGIYTRLYKGRKELAAAVRRLGRARR